MEYDSEKTTLPNLIQALKSQSSYYSVVEKGSPYYVESKHSLRTLHPELYYLDLTEQQAIALNSWSYFGGKMPDVLTESQKDLLPRVKAKLASDSPSFVPKRSGDALESYRKQLLQWLNAI